jgi:predicted RNA-binding protein (virulence factor B family)
MLKIGEFNNLTIARRVTIGLFLTDGEQEVLLPKKYMPEIVEVGAQIKVFIYLDQGQRPIATTLRPYIRLNDFSYLRVNHTNKFGAFMDWGLEKDLFVPFAEQSTKMETGKRYLVYFFMDEKSERLVASSKINRFLSQEHPTYADQEEVEIIIKNATDLGFNVIVNKSHLGLVYKNEVFDTLRPGDKHKGFIKQVRTDGKIDVGLTPTFMAAQQDFVQIILDALQSNNGFLPLHDKSSPEDVQNLMKMSKKNFKKAVGHLYKNQKISIDENGLSIKNA